MTIVPASSHPRNGTELEQITRSRIFEQGSAVQSDVRTATGAHSLSFDSAREIFE
jgi:hypothetical protein